MSKLVLTIVAAMLLVAVLSSTAAAQQAREIWMSSYMLLRIRNGAAGYSLDRRADEIQIRANNLLQLGTPVSSFTVRKAGNDANIYADSELFLTVTPADAAANGTTVMGLARKWAQRLRTIYPDAKARRPGTLDSGSS